MDELSLLLSQGFEDLDICTSPKLVQSFCIYLAELKHWNKAYNLTAITDDKEIITKHFFDSLLYLKALEDLPRHLGLKICDVGTGAGFPGLPLALAEDTLEVALVEPSHKKCAFLEHIIRLLRINNATVYPKSIQELKNMHFDVIVSRALFSLKDLIKKCRHLTDTKTVLVVSKAQKAESEIKQIPSQYDYKVSYFKIPTTDIQRSLITIYGRQTNNI